MSVALNDDDLAFDGEFNKQVIPPPVWEKLRHLFNMSHGSIHKGAFTDAYCYYLDGVADALYLDSRELRTAVELNY